MIWDIPFNLLGLPAIGFPVCIAVAIIYAWLQVR